MVQPRVEAVRELRKRLRGIAEAHRVRIVQRDAFGLEQPGRLLGYLDAPVTPCPSANTAVTFLEPSGLRMKASPMKSGMRS